jgi:hypothetical protein
MEFHNIEAYKGYHTDLTIHQQVLKHRAQAL